MNRNQQIGKLGEGIAAKWYCGQGFTLIYSNLRMGPLEIDLVFRDAQGWVLAEVKTLQAQTEASQPEAQLSPSKQSTLLRALDAFDHLYNQEALSIRYDLVAVLLLPGGRHVVRQYPDAIRV